MGCFDCRISQLPTIVLVCDCFRWRSEDAYRKALDGNCYWMLRKQGKNEGAATKLLLGISVAGKNRLRFQNGINLDEPPKQYIRSSFVLAVWI